MPTWTYPATPARIGTPHVYDPAQGRGAHLGHERRVAGLGQGGQAGRHLGHKGVGDHDTVAVHDKDVGHAVDL